ncbi:zinc finger protein 436-like [Anabrus simplex]|uniref:zinc finger protein 436-like n=1 Tax=Anabrus simplex TaxID=316456 RepID=UPI0035A392AE
MDLEVEIKEEPIYFDETSNTSCDNYKIISEEMLLKEEPKSELAVQRETQPSCDIKNDISVDEHTVDQLVTCFKGEDKFGNAALLTRSQVGKCNSRCKIFKEGSEVIFLPSRNECNLHKSCDSGHSPIHPISQLTLSCNECSPNFSQMWNVRQQLGTPSAERSHYCKQCGKEFSRKRYLHQHLLTHTGIRPFSCNQCGSKFTRRGCLTRHLLIHTGECQHSCDECGKKFSQKQYLQQHLLTHNGQRPHSCDQCGDVQKFRKTQGDEQIFLDHDTNSGADINYGNQDEINDEEEENALDNESIFIDILNAEAEA